MLLLLVGCTTNTGSEIKPLVATNESSANKPRIDYIGLRLNDESVSTKSKTIFEIQSDEQFNPTLEILNGFDSNQKYRVVFLVDYQQPVKFSINGQNLSYVDFEISPNSSKKVNVTFPRLAVGQHDLTTIIIREPDRFLQKPNFIPGYEHVLAHRSNIIVSTNKVNLPNFNNIETKSSKIKLNGNIILNQKPSVALKDSLSLIPEQNLTNVSMSFENEKEMSKYAVITLNLCQIKSDVKYVSANSRGIITLPIDHQEEIHAPTNLIVLAVENPFTTDVIPPLLSNKISIVY